MKVIFTYIVIAILTVSSCSTLANYDGEYAEAERQINSRIVDVDGNISIAAWTDLETLAYLISEEHLHYKRYSTLKYKLTFHYSSGSFVTFGKEFHTPAILFSGTFDCKNFSVQRKLRIYHTAEANIICDDVLTELVIER